MCRYYLVTNGPRGVSTWSMISSYLSPGSLLTLKIDLQESQRGTGFVGKAFFLLSIYGLP